jgi:hypothetical protein
VSAALPPSFPSLFGRNHHCGPDIQAAPPIRISKLHLMSEKTTLSFSRIICGFLAIPASHCELRTANFLP